MYDPPVRWAACCRKTVSGPNSLHTSIVIFYARVGAKNAMSVYGASAQSEDRTHQLLSGEYGVHDGDVRGGEVGGDGEDEDAGGSLGGGVFRCGRPGGDVRDAVDI